MALILDNGIWNTDTEKFEPHPKVFGSYGQSTGPLNKEARDFFANFELPPKTFSNAFYDFITRPGILVLHGQGNTGKSTLISFFP